MLFRTVDLSTARGFLWLAFLMTSPVAMQEGRSCFCFSEPLCNRLPDSDGKRIVFVGMVTDIFPRSLDAYGPPDSAFDENDRGWLERHKAAVLHIWAGVLTADEVRSVKLAGSGQQLRRVSDISMYVRRVRFRVKEWLEGNEGGEFEIFTESSSCGYSFQAGREYLVVSEPHAKTNRQWTGACYRTAPAESAEAQEDLRTLRARRDGLPIAPRVYGEVLDLRQAGRDSVGFPGARVRVLGPSFDREVISNAQGRFAFDSLVRGKYRIEITAPGALGLPRELDLSHGGCFEAQIFLERGAAGTEYKIGGSGATRTDVGSPPGLR